MAPFQIKIHQPLKPFSLRPGSFTLIPGSLICVQAFPTKLCFYSQAGLYKQLIAEINFKFLGVPDSFCMMLDLERQLVEISMLVDQRRFSLKILSSSSSLLLHFIKNVPFSFVLTTQDGCNASQTEGDIRDKYFLELHLKNENKLHQPAKSFEKLSLGCHQKLDIDRLSQKKQLTSILPLWLKLASSYQNFEMQPFDHPWSQIFTELYEKILNCRHDEILADLQKLNHLGLYSLLCPRLKDEDFQGLISHQLLSNKVNDEISPLLFLKMGAELIRSLFIHCSQSTITLLPHLLPEFFCGRYLNIATPFGSIDVEWTKKMVRRVVFRSCKDDTIQWKFPTSLKNFRLRHHKNEKGVRISCAEPFKINSGLDYFLDQFQK